MTIIETFARGCPPKHHPTPAPPIIRIDTSWGRHHQSTTAVTLIILAGSRPAVPALASNRQSRPHSRRDSCHPASDRRIYSCTHRRSLRQSDRGDLCAPISLSLTPRPNPHSVRCTAAAHLPRFRALALLGRRPPQPGDHLVMPASEKPAHNQTHAPQQWRSDVLIPAGRRPTKPWVFAEFWAWASRESFRKTLAVSRVQARLTSSLPGN